MGALAQTAPTTSGRDYGCKLRDLLSHKISDDDDQAAYEDRMWTRDGGRYVYSSRQIAAWLGVSQGTIDKHRNHECRACNG